MTDSEWSALRRLIAFFLTVGVCLLAARECAKSNPEHERASDESVISPH